MKIKPVLFAVFKPVFIVTALMFFTSGVFAQATTVVYSENFNSSAHGWVIGGYNPSWSYGIPSLTNIVSNSTNCFATGDAGVAVNEPFTSCMAFVSPTTTGNFYNCCERSFVISPTIDLTGVNSPLLSIDINVHCEQTFDGAKLQVSVNGGNSWTDVGVYTSTVFQVFPSSLNCREQNWYNKNSINYLSNTGGGCGSVNFSFGGSNSGWSGGCSQAGSGACTNPDSHGTNGWITATHCIPQTANKSNVRIRVVFGAGSQVYSDGIAFDNVVISDVYPVVAFVQNIVPGCEPQLAFTNLTDCAESYQWDFGHAGFPGNNSSASNPSHIFPSPGNYSISLSATDYCGGIKSITNQLTIPPGNAPVVSAITATSSGLCNSAVDSILIQLDPSSTSTGPYTVSWVFQGNLNSQNGITGNPVIVSGLAPGVYEQITLTDANGCSWSAENNVVIPLVTDGLVVDAGDDISIEIGNEVMLMAESNLAVSFVWAPPGTLSDPLIASPVATPQTNTVYTVTATSINGCTASDQVTIIVRDENPCNRYFIPKAFTPNGDGKNEIFRFIADPSMNIADYSLKIFNRWGEMIFASENVSIGWDGSDAPGGVYAFVMQLTCSNKKNSYLSGTLNLIR